MKQLHARIYDSLKGRHWPEYTFKFVNNLSKEFAYRMYAAESKGYRDNAAITAITTLIAEEYLIPNYELKSYTLKGKLSL